MVQLTLDPERNETVFKHQHVNYPGVELDERKDKPILQMERRWLNNPPEKNPNI